MAIDSIETIQTPRAPERLQIGNVDTPEEINQALNNIYEFARANASYQDQLYEILHSGALIRSWQVEELLAGSIGAGTISVDQIYLGSDKFELDGALGQIRIKDDAGIVMVEMGEFGSGTDWGIKVRDGSNNVKFSALSNAGVTLDGGIITNATINGAALQNGTITGAKIDSATITGSNIDGGTITNVNIQNSTITDTQINDVNGTKIDATSIANTKLISVSADKITLSGTLEISSTKTAIDVLNGGDISLTSGASDTSWVYFYNSTPTLKAQIGYDPSITALYIEARSGATDHLVLRSTNGDTYCTADNGDLYLRGDQGASGNVYLYADKVTVGTGTSGDTIDMNSDVDSHIFPADDNKYDLGFASTGRWRDIYTQGSVTTADIRFAGGEGVTLIEPHKVWFGGDKADGLVMMSADWVPVRWWKADGTEVGMPDLPPADIPKLAYQPEVERELLIELEDELAEDIMVSDGRNSRKHPGTLFQMIKEDIRVWENAHSENFHKITDQEIEDKKNEIINKVRNKEWTEDLGKQWARERNRVAREKLNRTRIENKARRKNGQGR